MIFILAAAISFLTVILIFPETGEVEYLSKIAYLSLLSWSILTLSIKTVYQKGIEQKV